MWAFIQESIQHTGSAFIFYFIFIQGFIINERKDDVNTFTFDMADPNVTPQFVRNYLWDLISAGANPRWDKI